MTDWPIKLDGSEDDNPPTEYGITTRYGKGNKINALEHDDTLRTIRDALNDLKDSITSIEKPRVTKTASYELETDDLGSTFEGDFSTDQTFTLPEVGENEDELEVAFVKTGTGNMTVSTPVESPRDTIGDLSTTSVTGSSDLAYIRLKYIHSVLAWCTVAKIGTWA